MTEQKKKTGTTEVTETKEMDTRIKFSSITAYDLVQQIRNEDIQIPDFQRPLVWTGKDINGLAVTIANGEPIPTIIVGVLEDDTKLLIDGQQRANACSYILEKFEKENALEAIEMLKNYEFPVIYFKTKTEDELNDYFCRVNAKSGLSLGEREKGKLLPQFQFVLNSILNNSDSLFLETYGKNTILEKIPNGVNEKGKQQFDIKYKPSYKNLTDKLIGCLLAVLSNEVSTTTSTNIDSLKKSNESCVVPANFEDVVENASELIGKIGNKKVVGSLVYLIFAVKMNPQTKLEKSAFVSMFRKMYVTTENMLRESTNGISCSPLANRANNVKATQEKIECLSQIYKIELKKMKELTTKSTTIDTKNAPISDEVKSLAMSVLAD